MKKFLFLIGVLLPYIANAGEWSYEANADMRAAYGYSDVSSQYEKFDKNNNSFGDGDINLSTTYEQEDVSLSINLDLMLGVDNELEDYNQGSWGDEVYAILSFSYGEL